MVISWLGGLYLQCDECGRMVGNGRGTMTQTQAQGRRGRWWVCRVGGQAICPRCNPDGYVPCRDCQACPPDAKGRRKEAVGSG